MDKTIAISALAALSHDARLDIFRLLVRAGDDGLPAGAISNRLDMPQNSASTNLAILHRAGLVTRRRKGRSVIYAADFDGMRSLIGFLMKDCCAETPARVDAALKTLSPIKGDTPCPACTSP